VLEGAIDLRLGVTRRMARQYSQLNRRHGFQIWRLPEKSICLIPPNVPFDDGDRPHWCGPDPSKARSRLHWIHLIPAGALLHSCHTVGTAHEISPFLCVHDPRLVLLGELLCEELGSASPRAREIAHANLLALLWRIEQGIAAAHFMEMEFQSGLEVEPDAAEIDAPDSIESAAVRRAHRFIQAHLHETLTVEAVAVAAYGSASWLNRQFQKELGLPIMQYVTQCRIREARLLLADTDLPVTEIGKLVGFPDPSYFSQVFTRWEKISPARFRHRHRSESN
jgi:AraC-like DNA-binding protein